MVAHSRVNFTNNLQAAFSYKSLLSSFFCTCGLGLYFFGKRKLVQKRLIKCWWNWLLGLISPTIYKQLFHWFSFTAILLTQNVSTEKLYTTLFMKKLLVKCWWNWHLALKIATSSLRMCLLHYNAFLKRTYLACCKQDKFSKMQRNGKCKCTCSCHIPVN